jgi:hypothetical protein
MNSGIGFFAAALWTFAAVAHGAAVVPQLHWNRD